MIWLILAIVFYFIPMGYCIYRGLKYKVLGMILTGLLPIINIAVAIWLYLIIREFKKKE